MNAKPSPPGEIRRGSKVVFTSRVRSPINGDILLVPDTQDPDDAIFIHAQDLGREKELPWHKGYEPRGPNLPHWATQAVEPEEEEKEEY